VKEPTYIVLTIIVLALRLWLAFLINKWAKHKGRTSGVWFFWAFAFLGPTALVLAIVPTVKPEPAGKLGHAEDSNRHCTID
jgi:hypothetical protein